MDNIIIFDSFCIFCNRVIKFIIKRDREAKFKFTALQSDLAKRVLENSGAKFRDPEFLVYIRRNTVLTKSKAVLMILRDLGNIWCLFYILIIVPGTMRNFFYDLIARNRYKFFGGNEHCLMLTREVKGRFL